MSKTVWKTMIELPSVLELSDETAFVTLRGSEFEDRDKAVAFFKLAKKQHEWPLMFVRSVRFSDDDDGPTANAFEEIE